MASSAQGTTSGPGQAGSELIIQRSEIIDELLQYGFDLDTAKYWCAVSAFETKEWKSTLYLQYHNMFGMGYPTYGQDYGHVDTPEGVKSAYTRDDQSIYDLVEYLQATKWPTKFQGLEASVTRQKELGYFTGDYNTYLNGVRRYF